ncbi:hypothetical protein MFFC18_06600 [Mariniblastus fucicola]|uniref:Uncharacterized protein n=1 Tax=Mariniblastus fucicola TaxID=980251 RepID=A0A5B9P5N4_9BACT|nr:hypothetical protein MFFC18_06600 [Mariniblastus fucicola]
MRQPKISYSDRTARFRRESNEGHKLYFVRQQGLATTFNTMHDATEFTKSLRWQADTLADSVTPLAQAIHESCRAVAKPSVKLSLLFELLASLQRDHEKIASNI